MSGEPPQAREQAELDLAARRLDPERAAALAAVKPSPPPPVIDTRRYGGMIGAFGLALVVVFSAYLLTTRGAQPVGIPAGRQLPLFVAPLATSHLNLDPNTAPRCDPARPNPQGLNVCGRSALVLGLFVTGSRDCSRQVDVIQAVSRQFAGRAIQFAAVAVNAGRSQTVALVRSHHWTIPVAYDRDGAIGALYGVSVCPMVELAYRGGVVANRLIGNHWLAGAALAARVRALLANR